MSTKLPPEETVAIHLIRARDHIAKAWMSIEWAIAKCQFDNDTEDIHRMEYLQDELAQLETLTEQINEPFIVDADL